jgi:hypothetical protein
MINLRAILAQVQSTETTRAKLEYVNSAAVRELISPERVRNWPVGELALGHLRGIEYHVGRLLGVEAEQMRTRVLVDGADGQAGRWIGEYDVARTDRWLADNGGEQEEFAGGTLWRTGPDDSIHDYENSANPTGAQSLAASGSLNVVQTAPGSFSWSVALEPLTWLTQPPTASLAEEPDFAELADALDDAVAAAVHRHESGVTYASGVEVATVDEVTEVVLARAGSVERAEEMVANATRARGGKLPAATEITLVGDSTVRAAWRTRTGHPITGFHIALTLQMFDIFG